MIPSSFINFASDILGATSDGLSGSEIAMHCNAYSLDFNVAIPYSDYPFPMSVGNKRTALRDNLKAFSPKQQYKIIKELCELGRFKNNKKAKDLKIKLVTKFGYLNDLANNTEINETLIEETKHWLINCPEALKPYQGALDKLEHTVFQRNLLDDLRLSLELLLKHLLSNDKPLEKQLSDIGQYVQGKHGSKEVRNMLIRLIDYYAKYQNTYVKHDDRVVENEIEFIFEMTSSFMKFLIRIK